MSRPAVPIPPPDAVVALRHRLQVAMDNLAVLDAPMRLTPVEPSPTMPASTRHAEVQVRHVMGGVLLEGYLAGDKEPAFEWRCRAEFYDEGMKTRLEHMVRRLSGGILKLVD